MANNTTERSARPRTNLKELISRLIETLKRNCDLLCVAISRTKAPIALVVTGLEHQEGEMGTWWVAKEAKLQSRMHFHTYACVTTITSENPTIQRWRSNAQERLHGLIKKLFILQTWNADLSWISWVISGAVHELDLVDTPGNTTIKGKVVVCDSFTAFLPGSTAVWIRGTAQIGDKMYEFYRVDKHELQSDGTLGGVTGAGVLVFYTSPLVDDLISPEDTDALKRFHCLAGGQLCPVIVVLRGCDNEQVAQQCYVQVTSRHGDIQPNFVSFPSTGGTEAELDEMIERVCTEHIKGIAHGPKRYIKKFLSPFFQ